MDKSNFFIKKNDIIELDIFGQVFKFKRITSDDELNWADEYMETKKIKKDGREVIVKKENMKKLVKCKLRNIVEVPFSMKEIEELTGKQYNKEFKEFTDSEKDELFGQLNPVIMNELISKIDGTKINQKKS